MLISRANQKNRFRRHDAKFNVSIQRAGRGYSFLRAEFGFNLWRRTHGRGARTMPVRTPAHSAARPPRRAAIRRRAAPRVPRVPPARNCIALRRAVPRCVRKKRTRRRGVRRRGPRLLPPACTEQSPTAARKSTPPPQGDQRARNPRPDPLRTTCSANANFC